MVPNKILEVIAAKTTSDCNGTNPLMSLERKTVLEIVGAKQSEYDAIVSILRGCFAHFCFQLDALFNAS